MPTIVQDPTTVHISPSQMPTYMIKTWKRKRIPIFHGGPGIGKTQIHKQVSDMLGLPLISMRAATREPTSIAGIPVPDMDEKCVRWMPDEMWPKRKVVWLFDELNRAPILTQNACFQLFDEGRIGNSTVPEGCCISVAVNRESDGGGVVRMPQALNNRFVHFHLEPSPTDWREWALDNDIDPLVIAFIDWKPDMLYQFSRTDDAWPSPRQWEFLSDVIKDDPSYDELKVFAYGTVGHTCVTEFMAFAQQYKAVTSVDIDNIIHNPKTAPIPREPSGLYAVSSALSERMDPKNLSNIQAYLERIGREYTVFAVKRAVRNKPELQSTTSFVKWAIQYKDVL